MSPGAERPLRVAHVLVRLSQGGGVPVVVRQLAAGLDPAEVELHVVTERQWIDADELDRVPAAIHPVGYPRPDHRPWDRVRVMLAVARLLRRVRPDVVQLHSGMSWMGALARMVLPRAGFVLEVHDAPGSGRHGRLTDRAEGWWVRYFGATAVCHSSSVAGDVRARWRPRRERVVVLPLAVDTERFGPLDEHGRRRWRDRYGLAPDDVAIVTAGRLVPSKRVDASVRALASLRAEGLPARLVVLGRGQEEDALRELAAELGVEDEVTFSGFVDDDEFAAAMAACDVMCAPSAYEGFGLTLVEGMACGLPVVATAVGGVTDVVDDGTSGVLVDPARTHELADHLRAIVVDHERRAAMGAAARRRAVERFSIPPLVRGFRDVYRSAARTAGRRAR